MFGKKKIKELENKVSQMELTRKDKKIAMMEKMMKLDQVRRGVR